MNFEELAEKKANELIDIENDLNDLLDSLVEFDAIDEHTARHIFFASMAKNLLDAFHEAEEEAEEEDDEDADAEDEPSDRHVELKQLCFDDKPEPKELVAILRAVNDFEKSLRSVGFTIVDGLHFAHADRGDDRG